MLNNAHTQKSSCRTYYPCKHSCELFELLETDSELEGSLIHSKAVTVFKRVDVYHLTRTRLCKVRKWSAVLPKCVLVMYHVVAGFLEVQNI